MEEGEGPGTGAWDEEEAQDEDNKEDNYEGTTTCGEDINGPDEDVDKDDHVSDRDKDFDWDDVRGGGGSDAEKWESGGRDGDEDK